MKLSGQAETGPVSVWMPEVIKPFYIIPFSRARFSDFRTFIPSYTKSHFNRVKNGKLNSGTKSAWQAINGPVWMPQVMKLL